MSIPEPPFDIRDRQHSPVDRHAGRRRSRGRVVFSELGRPNPTVRARWNGSPCRDFLNACLHDKVVAESTHDRVPLRRARAAALRRRTRRGRAEGATACMLGLHRMNDIDTSSELATELKRPHRATHACVVTEFVAPGMVAAPPRGGNKRRGGWVPPLPDAAYAPHGRRLDAGGPAVRSLLVGGVSPLLWQAARSSPPRVQRRPLSRRWKGQTSMRRTVRTRATLRRCGVFCGRFWLAPLSPRALAQIALPCGRPRDRAPLACRGGRCRADGRGRRRCITRCA